MESYNLSLLTQKILNLKLNLVSSKTLRDLLEIKNERTFYKVVNDFIKNGILANPERDKYIIINNNPDTFEIANFLYQPSYISLETALNYWGILSQFPFEVTSITSRKTTKKTVDGKIYTYSHVNNRYFGMFTKKNNCLIALPEKAVFDQLYLASKGIKTTNLDEYDFNNLDKKKFLSLCHQLKANKKMMNLVKEFIK